MKDAMKSSITIYATNSSEFEVREYDEKEKMKLLSYMRAGEVYAVAGLVNDCILGKWQKDENLGYKDGEFAWTEQDVYHVEKYNAAVTDDFLSKAIL